MPDQNQPVTTELYALVDLLCGVVSAALTIKAEGGKIGMQDLSLAMTLIPQLSPAFSNIQAVPSELEALQPADQVALVAHIAGKLSVVDSHAQSILAASLQAGSALYNLYKAIEAPKAA